MQQLLRFQQTRDGLVAASWREPPASIGIVSATPRGVRGPCEGYSNSEPACLVFDGLLDDRDTLARALDGNPADDRSDAALALRAYERWGIDGLGRLTGEFAIVLWDRQQRALIAARDLFGQRSLHYRIDANTIAVATEVQALVRLSPVAVNEGMVAEFLASRTASTSETLYRDIHRVPPGHALVARGGGLQIVTLCAIDAPPEVRSSPDDSAEEFRRLLRSAVRDRLDAPGPTGVLLSGGMDSSSILAAVRASGNGSGAPQTLACTLAFEGERYDESPFAREVVARVGGPSIVMGPAIGYDFSGEVAETLLPPTTPSAAVIAALRSAAAERGVRVMLTGVGADEWLGGTHWHYLDLIRRGRLLDAARRARRARQHGQPLSLSNIARGFAWDSTPRWVQRRIRQMLATWLYPDWLDAAFVKRVGLASRPRWQPTIGSPSLAQRGIWLDALSALQIEQTEEQTRFAARFGQEDRQPFLDRRLVRFALALPESERSAPGMTKIVQRRALAEALPDSVITRTSFFDYSFLIADAVAHLNEAGLFRGSRLVARGWVREPALSSTIDRALSAYRTHGMTHAADAARLWRVAALELWCRGVEPHLSN